MIPRWKLMKGIKCTCYKCHGEFGLSEFDAEEGVCHYCLFPEASKSLPTEMSYKYGEPLNEPMDNLDSILETPEVQSEKAKESLKKYKANNYKKSAPKPKKSTAKKAQKLPKSSDKITKKRKVYK